MPNLNNYQILYVLNAFLVQLILIAHFALRKWRFDQAMRHGWMVYAFCIPSVILSIFLLRLGVSWSLWMGGFVYLAWALFGYSVEYILGMEWRNSLRWSILVPYVVLYLATVMFYWWPLALIYKPLWYAFAFLFFIGTYLNVTSHKSATQLVPDKDSA